ncbi:TPA: hypothetical protein ACNV29_001961 [Klebsiella oxytoca]|uniref:hypothetical protein n=1 Tax=Klebsiella oxytoca TaxID=571 RepID=UPI001D0EF8D3|nr:hypothetical protein [Klebsiella oxytoca]
MPEQLHAIGDDSSRFGTIIDDNHQRAGGQILHVLLNSSLQYLWALVGGYRYPYTRRD